MSYDGPIPGFIIGGAPRSGTTFMCHLLDKHPAIFMAKPFIPEPKVFLTHADGRDAYLERYRTAFAGAGQGKLLGEKTANYFENEHALPRIREHLPQVKLMFILREPVGRAYSNWLWSTKNGLETLTFAEALALEGRRESPLPPEKAHARPFDYLARSRYATLAKHWIDTFGRGQVRFFLYEDIVRAPEYLSRAVQEYLGVEQVAGLSDDLGVINAAHDTGPPIDRDLERDLRGSLKPEVERFAELTGTDVGPWVYS